MQVIYHCRLKGGVKMKMLTWLFCILIILVSTSIAHADTVLLNDNFNSENGGIGYIGNYTSFNNWTVTAGYVDLVGTDNWDFLKTGGVYVDLDGSAGNETTPFAGTLTSKQAFNLTSGTVLLQFDLAGSQRGVDENYRTNTVLVKLGDVYSEFFVLQSTDPLTTYSRYINITTDTAANLSFKSLHDGVYPGDNIGALLDNVKLTAVPEPAIIFLLGLGLVGLAGVRRKFQK